MTALSASSLLTVWETGQSLTPIRRYLLLLSAAWPEQSMEEWAQAPLGQRDNALLALREVLFGRHVEAIAPCPACNETLELTVDTDQIRGSGGSLDEEGDVDTDGYHVRYRLPTSADLIVATETSDDANSSRMLLLQRCILSAHNGGQAVEATQMPPQLIEEVQKDMARLDPLADIRFALNCPQCGHGCELNFDIAAYLWDEIGDWAARLLREVHVLARAYGWSEQAILGLSARRRRSYLALLAT